MKFGAMQSLIAEPVNTVFATAARLGLDGVQLDWPGEKGQSVGDTQLSEIVDGAAGADVEIPSLIAHPASSDVIDPSDDAQAQARDGLRQSVAVAQRLGAAAVLVPFFGSLEAVEPEQQARLIANLRQVAPEAEAAGVTLAIESTLPAHEVVRIIEAIGSPVVGSYWDMGNALWLGYDPVHEVEILAGRIAEVHAKEFAGEPVLTRPRKGDGLNARPFGQGQVPINAVLSALREVGYDGYVVLETGVFGDRRESIRTALAALKAAASGSSQAREHP